MRLSAKLVFFAGLATVTFFATTKIVGQQVAKQAAPPAEQASKRALKPGEVSDPPDLPDGTGIEESAHVEKFVAEPRGDGVYVAASVRLMNKKPGGVYLWRLQAFRASNHSEVFDMPYDGQLFPMHESGQMAPTFEETLRIDPGKYQVVLSLHFFRDGYNPAQPPDLDHPDHTKRRSQRLSMLKDVEVR